METLRAVFCSKQITDQFKHEVTATVCGELIVNINLQDYEIGNRLSSKFLRVDRFIRICILFLLRLGLVTS